MNEEKALEKIRKNILDPKENIVWCKESEREKAAELFEALEALKKNRKIAERKFLKEKFDFCYGKLSVLVGYFGGKTAKDRLLGLVEQGDIAKINECLVKIVKEVEIRCLELGLNSRDAPEREAFCIPGCGLCCCLTRGSGVAVFDKEVRQVQEGIARFNAEYGERLVLDTEDIPTKRKNYEWVGRFRFGKFMVAALPASTTIPFHIKELSEHGFKYKGNLGYACHLLVDRQSERLSFERWKSLVLSYAAALRKNGKTLNLAQADFPGEFQGMMCGIHQYRPHECRSNGCNYARKIMPKILGKYGTQPLEKMFKEPLLIERYKIANAYFKG